MLVKHDGFITTEDILPLPDGTHMTDLGNRKMARLWSNAINQAETSVRSKFDSTDHHLHSFDANNTPGRT